MKTAFFLLLQKMGVEPTRYCYHTDLNRARLPIPPLLHVCPPPALKGSLPTVRFLRKRLRKMRLELTRPKRAQDP